jgi:hypothetical protein
MFYYVMKSKLLCKSEGSIFLGLPVLDALSFVAYSEQMHLAHDTLAYEAAVAHEWSALLAQMYGLRLE